MTAELPEHADVNQAHWDGSAHEWVASGERNWAGAPVWGTWGIPEDELSLLPADMTGLDAIELGCGTGYVSGWMAGRGARVVGIDLSTAQLATAQRLAEEHGAEVTFVHGSAEAVPYPTASFDFAISEYGAALWCDPYVWIPEAHRLLRPGGELVFMTSSTLAMLCSPQDGSLPITEHLERDYFSIHRFDWRQAVDEPGGIEFNLPTFRWFRLLRDSGFDVIDYAEVQAPRGGPEAPFFATADWAHRYPSEQVWRARRRVDSPEG
jgi:SAM-dependent methyltransferase